MKYKLLRQFMRNKNVKKDHILKDCSLVIDGKSYFQESYKRSGCQHILGGEYDRYASYLKSHLTSFKECNVECYVIFNGAMKADGERRREIHQKIIDESSRIVPNDDKYCEPAFVRDVYKQVLDELGIKYFICEYVSTETLFAVAKSLRCPVLTDYIENCLLGLSCITPSSIAFEKRAKRIVCKIHTPEAYASIFTIHRNLMPMFMTILDEDSPLYKKIPELVRYEPGHPVVPLLRWTKRQRKNETLIDLAKKLQSDAEKDLFFKTEKKYRQLIFYNQEKNPAVKYFADKNPKVLERDVSKLFPRGIGSGRIAIPYINLKNNGIFSGSWVICDKNEDDAMLSSIDLIMYAYSLLSDCQKSTITFTGRQADKSCTWDITQVGVSHDKLIKSEKPEMTDPELKYFVDNIFPNFDWSLLKQAPEDCRLLIIALVYYTNKKTGFTSAAYSILLSYVLLGPVSERVGLIKRSNLSMCHGLAADKEESQLCSYQDCLTAAHAFIEYFYEGNLKKTFDRRIVHSFAEFQHCLQQFNYLNKLCGEKMKGTCYYKAYNGTLVYNIYLRLKDLDDPTIFFDSHLKNSPSVLRLYETVKNIFDMLMVKNV